MGLSWNKRRVWVRYSLLKYDIWIPIHRVAVVVQGRTEEYNKLTTNSPQIYLNMIDAMENKFFATSKESLCYEICRKANVHLLCLQTRNDIAVRRVCRIDGKYLIPSCWCVSSEEGMLLSLWFYVQLIDLGNFGHWLSFSLVVFISFSTMRSIGYVQLMHLCESRFILPFLRTTGFSSLPGSFLFSF